MPMHSMETHGIHGHPWSPRVPMQSVGTMDSMSTHAFHGYPWIPWVPLWKLPESSSGSSQIQQLVLNGWRFTKSRNAGFYVLCMLVEYHKTNTKFTQTLANQRLAIPD
jgi:hypothetical protein